jgi:hypothetical protein
MGRLSPSILLCFQQCQHRLFPLITSQRSVPDRKLWHSRYHILILDTHTSIVDILSELGKISSRPNVSKKDFWLALRRSKHAVQFPLVVVNGGCVVDCRCTSIVGLAFCTVVGVDACPDLPCCEIVPPQLPLLIILSLVFLLKYRFVFFCSISCGSHILWNTVLYRYSSLTDQGKYQTVAKVRSGDYDLAWVSLNMKTSHSQTWASS